MQERQLGIFEGAPLEGRHHQQELRIVLSVAEVAEIALILVLYSDLGITGRAEACLRERLLDRREYRRGDKSGICLLCELAKQGHRFLSIGANIVGLSGEGLCLSPSIQRYFICPTPSPHASGANLVNRSEP